MPTAIERPHSSHATIAPKADGLSLADQPLLHAVHERAGKSVRMREGTTVSEVSARDALVQSVLATALKGNARSQGLALDLIRTADLQRARDRAENQAFAKDLKLLQARLLERAMEAGDDTRLILPHPDDIVIDDDYGYHIRGPIDQETLRKVEESVRYRDALIMQDVLDVRRAAPPYDGKGSPERERSGALLSALCIDRFLPERFRIDENALIRRLSRTEGTPLRQLLTDTYRAWKAAGVPVRRGARFANVATVRQYLEYLAEALNEPKA